MQSSQTLPSNTTCITFTSFPVDSPNRPVGRNGQSTGQDYCVHLFLQGVHELSGRVGVVEEHRRLPQINNHNPAGQVVNPAQHGVVNVGMNESSAHTILPSRRVTSQRRHTPSLATMVTTVTVCERTRPIHP